MENGSASAYELLAKGLPMHPILSALIANPAVVDASRRAVSEVLPIVERSLKGMKAGRVLKAASPTLLGSFFVAGIAVGWMTAPAKGSELRAQVGGRVRSWAKMAGSRIQEGTRVLRKQLARRKAPVEGAESDASSTSSDVNGSPSEQAESAAHH